MIKCGICEKNEANPEATISVRLLLPVADAIPATFGFEICDECRAKLQVANTNMQEEKRFDLGVVLGQAEIKNLKRVFKKITGVKT